MDSLSDSSSDGEDNTTFMEGLESTGGSKQKDQIQELSDNIAAMMISLQTNPNQYEIHTQLIAALRSVGMFEELRVAREAMSAIFPLSEDLWLEWINDESRMADTKTEKELVLKLYERATTDYLSITIWKSYTEYASQEYLESLESGDEETAMTKDMVSRIFREADKFTGHHIAKSHEIWNAWAEFEIQILDAQETPSQEDVKMITTMFEKRLTIAHAEIDNTVSNYISFVTRHGNVDFEQAMAHSKTIAEPTRKILAARESFELELTSSGNSLEAFQKYIDFETTGSYSNKKLLFPFIRTVFERALAVHCLVPTLWNDYNTTILGMFHKKKKDLDLTPPEILSITTRATRNCPWIGDLWENRILILEAYNKPEEEIGAVIAAALSDPNLTSSPQEVCKVVLAHCAYRFRRISCKKEDEDDADADADADAGFDLVRRALEHAIAVVDAAGGDPTYKLHRYWIDLEAFKFSNPGRAHNLWNDLISNQKTIADAWIAFAEMDRALNNLREARHTYKRGVAQAKHLDWPEKLFESYLSFERQNGSDDEYREALVRTREATKIVEAVRAKYGQGYTTEVVTQAAPLEAFRVPPAPVPVPVPVPTASAIASAIAPTIAPTKATASTTDVTSVSTEPSAAGEAVNKRKSSESEDAGHTFKVPRIEEKQEKPVQPPPNNGRLDVSKGRHEDTCYFTNFLPTTTDKQLKDMFNEEEAHAAVKGLNGRDVGERRGLVVNISDTSKAGRSIGDPPLPNESRHEIRVSGIADDITEQDLMKLVALYATPDEIYIHRKDHVHKDPWANIKFTKESDASAVLQLNGTQYFGRTLSVKRRSFIRYEDAKGLGRRERRRFKRESIAEGGSTTTEAAAAAGDQKGTDGSEATKNNEQGSTTGEKESQSSTMASSSSSVAETPSSSLSSGSMGPPPARSQTSVTTPSMAPRSMAPRSMAPRSMAPRPMAPRVLGKPKLRSAAASASGVKAFRPASTVAAGATPSVEPPSGTTTTTTTTTTVDSGDGGGGEAPKARSNNDFRAMLLSGQLKRQGQ
ncbi:Squamous cell carcinoma antigen recognized by T-cells 3 [Podila humilis]|nr:Squamous cell carcinoma antigen recognized by T-cells 3 [Podila humilis]